MTNSPATSATEKVALLPCPLCASDRLSEYDGGSYWEVPKKDGNVRCIACGCTAPLEKWNTRAAISSMPALDCEELAIMHGQQVAVTFKNSADAFALFNELKARAALTYTREGLTGGEEV